MSDDTASTVQPNHFPRWEPSVHFLCFPFIIDTVSINTFHTIIKFVLLAIFTIPTIDHTRGMQAGKRAS